MPTLGRRDRGLNARLRGRKSFVVVHIDMFQKLDWQRVFRSYEELQKSADLAKSGICAGGPVLPLHTTVALFGDEDNRERRVIAVVGRIRRSP